LDVNQLILHFVRRQAVEYFQQPLDKLGGGTPDSDDDPGVSQSFREILRRQEVRNRLDCA